MRFTDRREDVFGVHPVPEIRIDEARLDQAIASDDERRRKGQKPAVIALELVEIDTECLIRATNGVAGAEYEAESGAVDEVAIGQNRERQPVFLLRSLRLRPEFRHDGDHVATDRGDEGVRPRQRLEL